MYLHPPKDHPEKSRWDDPRTSLSHPAAGDDHDRSDPDDEVRDHRQKHHVDVEVQPMKHDPA